MSAVAAVPARHPRWPWLALAGFVAMAVGGSAVKIAHGNSIAEDGLFIVVFFGYGLVGALIASRVPGNPIGALLLYVSGVSALAFIAGEDRELPLGPRPSGRVRGVAPVPRRGGVIFGLLPGMLLLLQLFPDGSPLRGRWRWLMWGTVGLIAFFALALLGSRELGDPVVVASPVFVAALEPVAEWFGFAFLAFIGLMVLSVVSLVVRYRRSEGAGRQQIKWMAFAAVLVLLSFVLSEVLTEVGWSDAATSVIAAIGIAAVPAAIGIAVLRYRLWDLDIVVRKTVLVVLVLVILLALFGVPDAGGDGDDIDPVRRPRRCGDRADRRAAHLAGLPRLAAPGRPHRVRRTRHAVRGARRVRGPRGRHLHRRRRAACGWRRPSARGSAPSGPTSGSTGTGRRHSPPPGRRRRRPEDAVAADGDDDRRCSRSSSTASHSGGSAPARGPANGCRGPTTS